MGALRPAQSAGFAGASLQRAVDVDPREKSGHGWPCVWLLATGLTTRSLSFGGHEPGRLLVPPSLSGCCSRRLGRFSPHLSVTLHANRSAARTAARAFRGISGRLPAIATRWWAPSIYSTVPLRRRFSAALLVSHGDRRMRGRDLFDSRPNAEGSTALPVSEAAPSELRAGAL